MFEPTGDLLWRPTQAQLVGHNAGKRSVQHQFA
jgi:hypothetical protein